MAAHRCLIYPHLQKSKVLCRIRNSSRHAHFIASCQGRVMGEATVTFCFWGISDCRKDFSDSFSRRELLQVLVAMVSYVTGYFASGRP